MYILEHSVDLNLGPILRFRAGPRQSPPSRLPSPGSGRGLLRLRAYLKRRDSEHPVTDVSKQQTTTISTSISYYTSGRGEYLGKLGLFSSCLLLNGVSVMVVEWFLHHSITIFCN